MVFDVVDVALNVAAEFAAAVAETDAAEAELAAFAATEVVSMVKHENMVAKPQDERQSSYYPHAKSQATGSPKVVD